MDGATPLYLAAFPSHTAVVQQLIVLGAAMNIRDTTGGTPLHAAVMAGHMAVVELLITQGAELQEKGQGWFHTAAYGSPGGAS